MLILLLPSCLTSSSMLCVAIIKLLIAVFIMVLGASLQFCLILFFSLHFLYRVSINKTELPTTLTFRFSFVFLFLSFFLFSSKSQY